MARPFVKSLRNFYNRNRKPVKVFLYSGLVACLLLIIKLSLSGSGTRRGRRGQINSVVEIDSDIIFGFARALELAQNDSKLLEYIRHHHVFPASTEVYDLQDPKGDPVEGYGKDSHIVLRLQKNMKTKGFFIEAGAHDGEYLSQTLVLERDYKWTGLLVEPDPIPLRALFSKRRKAWISDTCLSRDGYPEQVPMQRHEMRPEKSKLIGPYNVEDPTFSTFSVKCLPLFSLLSAINVFKVDYFRLSVEKSELDILKTIPFDDVFIKTISVNIHPSFREEIIYYLKKKSYKCFQRAHRIPTNDFLFIHSSVETYAIEKDETVSKCKRN